MRILVADDDDVSRLRLEGALRRQLYEVVCAADGIEAWQLLKNDDAPRLAIIDWKMPGMDGVELCRRLRTSEKASYVYVIMLSSMSEKQDLITGLEAGADDYLIKPFHAQELNARVRTGERILKLQEALRVQATHDALTGVLNRGTIMDILAREFARAVHEGKPLAVVMADLDHFKNINDTHGHLIGDAVLRESAQRMSKPIRAYDALGRYGGEEFLILLPGCALETAGRVAHRIRSALSAQPVSTKAGPIDVSASFGVAVADNSSHAEVAAVIESADKALYSAKRAGRNRVELA